MSPEQPPSSQLMGLGVWRETSSPPQKPSIGDSQTNKQLWTGFTSKHSSLWRQFLHVDADDVGDGNPHSVMVEPLRPATPSPLALAILEDNVPCASRLLEASPSSLKQHAFLGLPPLRLVCQTRSLTMMRLLLAAGAEVSVPDVQTFPLAAEAEVDEFDSLGFTPLHAAAEEHWLEGAQLLLEYGASVSIMGPPLKVHDSGLVQESPLHCAIRTGNLPLTLLMLGRGDEELPQDAFPHTPANTPTGGMPPRGPTMRNSLHYPGLVSRGYGSPSANYPPVGRSDGHPKASPFTSSRNSSPMRRLGNSAVAANPASGRPPLQKTEKKLESGDISEGIKRTNGPDLSQKDGTYRSVVHLAAMSNSKAILQVILSYKECQLFVKSGDMRANSPVHSVFSEIGHDTTDASIIDCIGLLLEYEVNVNAANLKGETPLFEAAKKGRPDALLYLLDKGADPKVVNSDGWTTLHAACNADCWKCLKHLLDTNRVNEFITKENKDGSVPFYMATCSYSLCCLKQLLRHGDHLTNEDSSGKSRCVHLMDNIPSANKFLEEMFDECVAACSKRHYDPEYTITFDYSSLLSQKFDGVQCSLISELTSSPTSHLFSHPLIESFLFIKWNRIKTFFYTNFVIYFMFLVLHTFYVIRTFGRDAIDWSQSLAMLKVFRCFHILLFLIILIPDMIIMLANILKYLRQWETYVKLITLSTSAFIVFSQQVEKLRSEPDDMMIERHVAAVSIFFSWLELMMLLGRFPVLGIYILMFTRVAKSIIKFLLAFSSLLIGFAIAFEIIFTNDQDFRNFPVSLVKTLMMMIGEIDYGAIVEESGMSMPVLGYIFLVVFLFLVPILMANLLIGLAVSDLPDLNRQGKIKRLSKQASYLTSYELLILFFKELRCFPHFLRRVLAERCHIKSTFVIYPNKSNFSRARGLRKWMETLPTEILEHALEIVQKQKDRSLSDKLDDEDDCSGNKVFSAIANVKQTPPNPMAKLVRSLSTISRHTNTSDAAQVNAGSVQQQQQQLMKEAYDKFEKEYKIEFQSLKQYIRSHLMYHQHLLSASVTPSAVVGKGIKCKGSPKAVTGHNCHSKENVINGATPSTGATGAGNSSDRQTLGITSENFQNKLDRLENQLSEQNKLLLLLLNRETVST